MSTFAVGAYHFGMGTAHFAALRKKVCLLSNVIYSRQVEFTWNVSNYIHSQSFRNALHIPSTKVADKAVQNIATHQHISPSCFPGLQ